MSLAPPTAAAVLLDRDGCIIRERHYLHDPAGVELIPGALEGLRLLRDLGLPLVLVTNQSGVGRGLFRRADVQAVHARLEALLAEGGVRLAGIYTCPHRPEDGCACRKPATGLAECAAQDLGLAPARCFVVGDKRCDVDLGLAWGARSLLVRTGYGAREAALPDCRPHVVVEDLFAAAHWIREQLTSSGAPVE